MGRTFEPRQIRRSRIRALCAITVLIATGISAPSSFPQAVSGAFTFTVSPDDPRAGDCVWLEAEAGDPLINMKLLVTGGLQPVYRSVRDFKGPDGKVQRVHWIWVIPNAPRGKFNVTLSGKSSEKGKRLDGTAVLTVEAPAPAAAPNLLVNGDFEQGAGGGGSPAIPRGWMPWSAGRPAPEYAPQSIRDDKQVHRVRHGETAWRVATASAAHDAGLMQTVKVPAGTKLRLKAHAMAWTSVKDDPTITQGDQKYLLRVGIDPEGGKDPAAGGVVWSKPKESPDRWTALAVEAEAKGEAVTVYLRGTAETAAAHHESFWDYVTLAGE